MTGADWTRVSMVAVLAVVVVSICILSVESRLAGEAATMLGTIAGYLAAMIVGRPALPESQQE